MWDKADFGTVALAFPGAGIQPSGYEASFCERHAGAVEPVLARASQATGVDLAAGLSEEGFDALSALDTQRFTYAYSLGVLAALRARGVRPALVAGHSLGVYATAACAGCVSFEDGLALLDTAFRLATEETRQARCGMVATAGLTRPEVDGLLADLAAPSLERVIANSSMSMVVAGRLDELETFAAAALAAEARRVLWLDREVAYHHPEFLGAASPRFAEVARELSWHDPQVPLVSSIDAATLTTAEAARDFVVRNLSTPIRWDEVLVALARQGVRTVFESGPGTTLTRMGRFVDADLKYLNVKKIVRRGG